MGPRLTEIWRYPVKSMGGERLSRAELLVAAGIAGDREWALRDLVAGSIVSAKRDPRMLYLWAGVEPGAGVVVGIPGVAEPVAVDRAAEALSAWLGRRVETVRWAQDDRAHVFDFGFPVDGGAHSFGDGGDVLHLVTTATARAFAELAAGAMGEAEAVRRMRPNLVLDAGDEPFAEDRWVGGELAIGTARLSVLEPTTRCRMVDRGQPGFPARDELLEAVTDGRGGRLGVYATVIAPGLVREGQVARAG